MTAKVPSSSTTISCLNSLLTSMVLIGLGVIVGFGIFHSTLHHRYVDRIYRTEKTHNRTLSMIRDQYIETDKERRQCIETDAGRLGEMSELRGRLEAQYKSWHDLTETQRSLYGQHQKKVDQVNDLQAQVQQEQRTLKDREEELGQKDRALTATKEEMESNYQIKIELESELTKMKEVNNDQTHECAKRIEQIGIEIFDVDKKSKILDQRNNQLEHEFESMKHSLEDMQTQMEQKDEELFLFRKEEGNLEKKLVNLREGMLDLLQEKINEIQNLENQVDGLRQEKEALEEQLENWRDGMLDLVREKMMQIDALKVDLSDSQETIKEMKNEIDSLQMDRAESTEFIKGKVDAIYHDSQGDDESAKATMDEIEELKAELEESQVWINDKRDEIKSLESKQTESQQLITEKTNEIDTLKSELIEEQAWAKARIVRFELDLTTTRELVQTKMDEVKKVNSQLKEFVDEIDGLKSDLFKSDTRSTGEIIIHHVQQRDSVICRQLFGKGPYYVKFVINQKITGEIQYFFVIEIPYRKELPHSIYTFLTLVESNLYNNGAAFLSARDGGFQIVSNSNDGVRGGGITLEHKLKPLGMSDGSALSFQETSISGSTQCGPNSFGFAHRGPGLNLFISPNDDEDSECFGQVIRGQDSLDILRASLLESGSPVEILSVTHLRVD